MKHKMRTLQGQYKALIKRNQAQNKQLAEADDCIKALQERHHELVKRSCSVIRNPDGMGNVITVRVMVDDVKSPLSRTDILKHICEDISRKAGWIR